MKAILDVHYEPHRAISACVVFQNWRDHAPARLLRTETPAASGYRAGRFYERELPSLLAVLEIVREPLEAILIDGFVHLKGKPGKGLGAHLFDALASKATIIGVAKNPLITAHRFLAVRRGRSEKPLYVSAIGCSLSEAAHIVVSMHGPHRIPTLIKIADRHARGT